MALQIRSSRRAAADAAWSSAADDCRETGGATGEACRRACRGIRSKIAKADISEEDARIAKFVLCETADDIIGNLPGSDQTYGRDTACCCSSFRSNPPARLLRSAEHGAADPQDHCDLVELLHVCPSLIRRPVSRPGARRQRSRTCPSRRLRDPCLFGRARRRDLTTLARLVHDGRARLDAVPLWVVGAATAALLTAAFFALRVFITDEGDALAGKLLALNPTAPVTIERVSFVPLTEEVKATGPTISQIDRISAALAQDIANGGLTVGTKGDFVVVEINNLLLFESGKADVRPEFEPIAARVAPGNRCRRPE